MQTAEPLGKLAYGLDEVAEALSVSRDTLNNWIRVGKMGSIKLGKRRLVTQEQLDQLIEDGLKAAG
jgi:excisionase family DNA binding protein